MQCEALFNQIHGENSETHLSTTIGLEDVLFKKRCYLFSEGGDGSERGRETLM